MLVARDPVGDTREDNGHSSSWLLPTRFPLQRCCLPAGWAVGALQEPVGDGQDHTMPWSGLAVGPPLLPSTSVHETGSARDNGLFLESGEPGNPAPWCRTRDQPRLPRTSTPSTGQVRLDSGCPRNLSAPDMRTKFSQDPGSHACPTTWLFP